jgi:alkylation response protein AidB-like acyl-CoA dehydrogenase
VRAGTAGRQDWKVRYMSSGLSPEHEELRQVVRQFLEAKSPESAVRAQMATDRGFDPAVWRQLAGQLGLQGLAIPEAYGGSGFGAVELSVVLEEMGRALLCAPYFSTVVLAASALLHCGDEQAKADLLPGIASGDTIATLALVEDSGRWDEPGVRATAAFRDDGWEITGSKCFVLDGHIADLILVAARTAAGVSLFAVDAAAPGLTRTLLPTLDQTRKQARLDLNRVPCRLTGTDGAGWQAVERVLDLAAVALAAEEVGGAQKVLDASVEYAKLRIQFGRPIGSFQAIKHKCADVLLAVETARSAAYYAARCAASLSDELPPVASLAKAYCSDAYVRAASENIQVHGGLGFTWEHPAHLYLKRAKSSQSMLGTSVYHRERLADRIGL